MHTSDKMWSIGIMLILIVGVVTGQEDSLQSALNAVDRRQRDLAPGYKNFYAEGGLGRYYAPDDKDDLAFLTTGNGHFDLLDYIKDDDFNHKKRFSSSFRERIDKDKAREKEELAEMFINRLQNNPDRNEDNGAYLDLLQQLYGRYRKYPDFYESPDREEVKKRSFPSEYYPSLGDSVGLKKKSRYFEPDGPSESLYLLNYAPRDELFDRVQEDDGDDSDSSPDDYNWNLNQRYDTYKRLYPQAHSMQKRFPVAKRSNPPTHPNELSLQSKRTVTRGTRNLAPTDPKVAKELSSIFRVAKTNPTDKPKKIDKAVKPKKTEHDLHEKNMIKNITSNKKNYDDRHGVSKEVLPNSVKGEPLQIKKKSVDWSDYFGYDRKKKSNGDIDNAWLMERYHKAIAMATKRNAEYPLQNFHKHDKSSESNDLSPDKKTEVNDEESKLVEMDLKLKNIEDSIVEEALKYTGAHEGATDSKEIQEIKDKVISRLAAAYSLEKMRQALGEYKTSIAKQRKQLKESGKLDDMSFYEEKRVSVPRKQAGNEREKIPEGDNNIKCSHDDEDCDEQTYKPSSDVLEEQSHWTRGDCPQIERACNEVAEVLGNYGRTLEPACNMHQVCLLCGENSWFAPTRQCNVLFLAKADELCDGDSECNKIATHSVRYLLDIYRSLRSEHRQECDLPCPDNRR